MVSLSNHARLACKAFYAAVEIDSFQTFCGGVKNAAGVANKNVYLVLPIKKVEQKAKEV